MSNKLQTLQQALNSTQPKVTKPEATVVASSERAGYLAPSREGKTNITAYLSPNFKASLRLIQARTGVSLQALVAEALNDLFTKYDVPTVRDD
jgi:hypothetical protein